MGIMLNLSRISITLLSRLILNVKTECVGAFDDESTMINMRPLVVARFPGSFMTDIE